MDLVIVNNGQMTIKMWGVRKRICPGAMVKAENISLRYAGFCAVFSAFFENWEEISESPGKRKMGHSEEGSHVSFPIEPRKNHEVFFTKISKNCCTIRHLIV